MIVFHTNSHFTKSNIRTVQHCGNHCSPILRGSLSIECAGSLSLFFFACITLMLFLNAIKMQTKESLALSNKARKLAAAASVLDSAGSEGSSSGAGSGSSSGSGSGSESSSGSDSDGGSGSSDGLWIDIPKSLKFTYPFPVFGIPKLRIAVRARVFPWRGINCSISDLSPHDESSEDSGVVYLTDNESVYHTHADCTHLDLTVIKTNMNDVKKMRNQDGKRYKKCKGFPKNYSGDVYVTARGRYYYPSDQYGSLTRHVHVAKKSDHADRKHCERCASRDAKEKAA